MFNIEDGVIRKGWDIKIEARKRSVRISLVNIRDINIYKVGKKELPLLKGKVVTSTKQGNCRSKKQSRICCRGQVGS